MGKLVVSSVGGGWGLGGLDTLRVITNLGKKRRWGWTSATRLAPGGINNLRNPITGLKPGTRRRNNGKKGTPLGAKRSIPSPLNKVVTGFTYH